MEINKKGLLMILSGPSGCGKGTIVSQIIEASDRFCLSVSNTTRKPRVGEIDGVHYHFIDRNAFEKKIADGEMLEYAEYCGNYYGTPEDAVNRMLDEGINVILEIEMVGAMKVRKARPDAVSILLLPPSYEILENRLRSRGTNDDADIERRLSKAVEEFGKFDNYDYVVVNQEGCSQAAADEITEIIEAERHRTTRNQHIKKEFIK